MSYIHCIKEYDLPKRSHFCNSCGKGKSTRVPRKEFLLEVKQAKKATERVHTDVIGAMKPELYEKPKYFVTILDEFGGYSIVRFLNRREETGGTVTEVIKQIEKLFNSRFRTLTATSRSTVKWLCFNGE